jgi:hypothetical protein
MECTLCNYTAKTKAHYQKHCKTGKHLIKENDIRVGGMTRNSPETIITELNKRISENKITHDDKVEKLIKKYEEQLREKERTIQAKINIEIAQNAFKKQLVELEIVDHWGHILIINIYNENKAMKAKIDQMEKQLIKTIDISGNYVIGRKLI